jgi:hypothetical protein
VKAKLTESVLRRIIFEEMLEHYLVQQDLWGTDPVAVKQSTPKVNKGGQTA